MKLFSLSDTKNRFPLLSPFGNWSENILDTCNGWCASPIIWIKYLIISVFPYPVGLLKSVSLAAMLMTRLHCQYMDGRWIDDYWYIMVGPITSVYFSYRQPSMHIHKCCIRLLVYLINESLSKLISHIIIWAGLLHFNDTMISVRTIKIFH